MSNLGFRSVYRYFCEDEATWVTVETAEGKPPSSCVNNAEHKIKPGSVIMSGRILVLKPILQTHHYDTSDMRNIDGFTVVSKCEELAKRVKVLEELLQKLGQIKFV